MAARLADQPGRHTAAAIPPVGSCLLHQGWLLPCPNLWRVSLREAGKNFSFNEVDSPASWITAAGARLPNVAVQVCTVVANACVSSLQIFVISSDKIQTRGYETLYQFACQNEKSLFGRVVLRAQKRLQVHIELDANPKY